MKILFLSSLYSSPLQAQRSPGNTRIVLAMRRHADVRVMVPLPWYPEPLVRRFPDLHPVAQVPCSEPDRDGSTILHPRVLHIPRVGRALYAGLYAGSVLGPVWSEVRRFRPDALLSAWAYPDGTAAVALGHLLALPTVVRVMGSDINAIAKLPWRGPQIRWAMRRAARIIAVSHALGDEVATLGTSADRIAVIPTGVDQTIFRPLPTEAARRELGLPSQRPLILVPGRLSREKGVHHFLDALAQLAPPTYAVVVGDGIEAPSLKEQAQRLGLAERVRFAGFEPEARMPLYYSAADVTCLPSLEEGWPDVLMESFACGCPVVATHVGGSPEIVALTGAGRTVAPGDPDALAQGLGASLAQSWNRRDIVQSMAGLGLDETARRYVATCTEAASGRTPRLTTA